MSDGSGERNAADRAVRCAGILADTQFDVKINHLRSRGEGGGAAMGRAVATRGVVYLSDSKIDNSTMWMWESV